jgi:hypothetical protein
MLPHTYKGRYPFSMIHMAGIPAFGITRFGKLFYAPTQIAI